MSGKPSASPSHMGRFSFKISLGHHTPWTTIALPHPTSVSGLNGMLTSLVVIRLKSGGTMVSEDTPRLCGGEGGIADGCV